MDEEIQIRGVDNIQRFSKLMNESVKTFDLDLRNLTVLTEAASNNYICTPIIAALAGSENVYAFAKDTKYGKAKDIYENTFRLAKHLGLDNNIRFLDSLDPAYISKADVITNLGPLRPMTNDFIQSLKETAVIPLMRETWEFREGEIDLGACKRNGVVVLGTNENHPDLRIFDYLGQLCAKKLLEAGIEIFKSKVLVLGREEFGTNITKYLEHMGTHVEYIAQLDKIPKANLENLDAIVVATYPEKDLIIGDNGLLRPEMIKQMCPGVTVVQFKGNVDRESIARVGIGILPSTPPRPGHMSWTLNELGPKPVIDLHTGGLKVGEIVSKLRIMGDSPKNSIEKALKNNLVQDFSEEQKKKYFTHD